MASPTLVAHRGFAGTYPQNTVRAVRRAGGHPGAAMVEVDVQPAAGGTPVVIHDSQLGTAPDGGPGLTDGEGVVWETPLDEVTAAEVLGSGETVPTLAAVVEACPDDVRLNVELKNPGTHDIRPGANLDADALAARREVWAPFVERVLEECADTDVQFSSFCEAALAVADERGDHPTAALCLTNVTDGVAVAREHDCAAIHPPVEALLADDPRVDPWAAPDDTAADDAASVPDTRDTVLDAAADHGWAVNAWTVREWHEAARLAALGVDGCIADHPSLLPGLPDGSGD